LHRQEELIKTNNKKNKKQNKKKQKKNKNKTKKKEEIYRRRLKINKPINYIFKL